MLKNSNLFSVLKKIDKKYRKYKLQCKRVFSKKAFACLALHGDSDYNICINSDLTVSCNCQDVDGSGHIGDLRKQSFADVFFGQKTQSFRESLSKGDLPASNCVICKDLILISKDMTHEYLYNSKLPHKGMMLENTVLCNLSCLGCDRKALLQTRGQKSLSIDDVNIVAEQLGSLGLNAIAFFNLGEPFLSPNVADEIKILREHNPKTQIFTSTNGVYLDSEEKIKSALLLDHIFFSIDGCDQESLSKYQAGGDFEKSYENLKTLVFERNKQKESRTVIEWKYVVFRWNDQPTQIEKAIDLAQKAKVDIISFCQGRGNPTNMSMRYKYHPFYKSLGKQSWKGREIDFRKSF